MDSGTSSATRIASAKIAIAGGFGVGKTTLVGAISEITPLTTEVVMTTAAEHLDDTTAVPGKAATTVAMDFGRITIADDLILYLFGTPGQSRFWFMWDKLSQGAIGAVLLVDPARISDCFGPVDFFENQALPYLIAVNHVHGNRRYSSSQIRDALAITDHVPLLACDPRDRANVKDTLITLVRHAISSHAAATSPNTRHPHPPETAR